MLKKNKTFVNNIYILGRIKIITEIKVNKKLTKNY